MKRLISVLLMAILLLSNSMLITFASEEHTHSWTDWEVWGESTCWYKGSEGRFCEECGAEEYRDLPLTSHTWSGWEVTRAATPYKAGQKVRTCYECDKTEKKTINKRKLTTNQKKAIKTVKTYLQSAKKYDYKKMNKCFAKTKSKYGYPTTKYYKKLFKKHNKKIKWQFVDATGKGNTIKVKVKVTRPAFYKPFYNAFYKTCVWYLNHPNASDSSVANNFNKKVKAYLKKYTKKTSTKNVTFTVIKTKKGWKIKAKSRTVVDIACGYMNEAMDDAENDFIYDYSW